MTQDDTSRTGYVYVLVSQAMPGMVLIGETAGSVEEAAKQASAAEDAPFRLAFAQLVSDCRDAKASLLDRLGEEEVEARSIHELELSEVVALFRQAVDEYPIVSDDVSMEESLYMPSSELATICGEVPKTRETAVRCLWEYIKVNQLQDTENLRMINVDDRLAPILGSERQISMFQMTKEVTKHLKRWKPRQG